MDKQHTCPDEACWCEESNDDVEEKYVKHLCQIVKEQHLLHVQDDYLRELLAGDKADVAEAASRILQSRHAARQSKKRQSK